MFLIFIFSFFLTLPQAFSMVHEKNVSADDLKEVSQFFQRNNLSTMALESYLHQKNPNLKKMKEYDYQVVLECKHKEKKNTVCSIQDYQLLIPQSLKDNL